MNRRQIQNLSSFRRFLRAPGIRLAREALPSLGPEWDVAYLTAWCMVGVGSTPSGKNMPEICKYLETDLNGPCVGTQKPKNLSKLIYDKKLEKFLTRSKICRFLFSKYKAALELLTNRHLTHDYKRRWDTSWKGVIYNIGKKPCRCWDLNPRLFDLLYLVPAVSQFGAFQPPSVQPTWAFSSGQLTGRPLWLGAVANKLPGTESRLSLTLYALKE